MDPLYTLDFSVFYRALFGGTEGGRIKRQGDLNQPTRVNRLLLGEYPENISFGQISREVANKLIKGTTNMTKDHIPNLGKQTGDPYMQFLPVFTSHVRSMRSDILNLPNLEHSIRLLHPMLQAAGISANLPDMADKEEVFLFLGKALTIAVLNSRNTLERKRRAASSLEAGVQDWESAVRLADRRGGQTASPPAVHTLSSVRPTGFSVFCGREEKVQELRKAFALQNVVFLYGMGGIGKTALACHYWRTFYEDYNTVVFAPFESSLAALLADDSVFRFSGLCRREKEDGTLQTDAEYALEKLRLLRETQDERTLIILDNYDVEDAELFRELVRGARFHLLVTTQLKPEAGDYCPVRLSHIDEDDPLKELFLRYADTVMLRCDDPAFSRLFDVTERHTLTLEVAAKHMAVMGITSLEEIVDLLENESYTCLAEPGGKDRYQKLRALLRLSGLTGQEIAFLRCLALVPPAGIDMEVFRDWCGDCFPAMNRLARLSLIKQDPENRTLSLHSVLRRLILEELSPNYGTCRDFIHRVMLVGEDPAVQLWEMPYEEKRLRLHCCRQILRHIQEITEETRPVFENAAVMLTAVGDFTEGLALQERIIDFVCGQYGRDSKPAMLALSEKARILGCMDETCGAAKCYTEAADWFLAHPEEGDLRTCIAVQACARSWLKEFIFSIRPSSLRKHEDYWEKSIEYMERLIVNPDLSEQTRSALRSRLTVARLKSPVRGEDGVACFDEGLELDWIRYQNSMDLLETRGFSGIPGLREASSFFFGKLDYRWGKFQTAVEHLEESRDLLLQYFGRREPRLVEVLETLYLCYTKLGDEGRAEQTLQEALEIARTVLVSNHFTLLRLEGYAGKA